MKTFITSVILGILVAVGFVGVAKAQGIPKGEPIIHVGIETTNQVIQSVSADWKHDGRLSVEFATNGGVKEISFSIPTESGRHEVNVFTCIIGEGVTNTFSNPVPWVKLAASLREEFQIVASEGIKNLVVDTKAYEFLGVSEDSYSFENPMYGKTLVFRRGEKFLTVQGEDWYGAEIPKKGSHVLIGMDLAAVRVHYFPVLQESIGQFTLTESTSWVIKFFRENPRNQAD